MTVPVQTIFNSSTANGATTVFPYSFKIANADDLEVSLDGVKQTSGYTVSGVGVTGGGNVTFTVAPADGTIVLRALNPILNRVTDYQQFGDWVAEIVNLDFDRMWLALQKFANDFKRALKLPVDTATDQVINSTALERANKLLQFDSNGNLSVTPITSIAVNVSAGSFTVDTFNGTGAQTAFVLSRDPGIKNNTNVFVGGVYQRKDQYSITGTTLAFNVAPASGTANIEVAQSVALEAGSPADNTVTTNSIVDGAVTTTKIVNGAVTTDKLADAELIALAGLTSLQTTDLLGLSTYVGSLLNDADEATFLTSIGLKPVSFSVHKNNVNQPLPTAAFTKVTWSTEEFDTNSNFDSATNNRFTVTIAGKYALSASLYIGITNNAHSTIAAIYKNGVLYKKGLVYHGAALSTGTVTVTIPAVAAIATDYFEVFAYTSDPSGGTISGDTSETYFTGSRISP